MKNITQKPLFWGVFSVICAISIAFTFNYFSKVFSLINIDLTMDKHTAQHKAHDLAQQFNLGPQDYQQAASFATDTWVKTYVELEGGGKEAFNQMAQGALYQPYIWQVRHFKAFESNETTLRFTPDGQPYGFIERLSENTPGPHIDADKARSIAERAAVDNWQINIDEYTLVESSKEVRPSERADHTFVYERPHIKIGEGLYRLRLTVSGDRCTEVTRFIKVPEEFGIRYAHMRSANNSIATAANIFMMLFYLIGGCIIGLFLLSRRNLIIWKQPLIWGIGITLLQTLVQINHLPLTWMYYDTALPMQGFLLQQIVNFLYVFLYSCVINIISFTAAESLTRAAFGHHIQLWRTWSSNVASSLQILGRTLGGYLIVPLHLAFIVLFYFIAAQFFGWWFPSETLFDPNILATYVPWFSPAAISLKAGFWEECLFRAVPLAGAALIGKRFGRRTLWITIAFIVQAIIFGAAHANYPAHPAYFRIIELIIPSAIFGGVYLMFGLIPSIIAHFIYDLTLFSLPLFISSAPYAWINQIAIIVIALIPLLIVLRARLQKGRWFNVSETDYNRTWQPLPTKQETTTPIIVQEIKTFSPKIIYSLIGGAILGLGLWFATTQLINDAPALTMTRQDAITHAKQTITQQWGELSNDWTALQNVIAAPTLQHRFIWQEGDKDIYQKLLGTYLSSPHWFIRFVKFNGSEIERAEEYHAYIAPDGITFRMTHKLPQMLKGAELSEKEARTIAHTALQTNFNLDPHELNEISATASQQPNRKDWLFIFANKAIYPLQQGEARIAIEIGGNEVVDSSRYIHIPEDWERNERKKENLKNIISTICNLIVYLLFIIGAFIALKHWSSKSLSIRTFIPLFLSLVALSIVNITNIWPTLVVRFNTSEPFYNQVFMMMGMVTLSLLLYAAIFSLLIGLLIHWKTRSSMIKDNKTILLGFSIGIAVTGILALIQWFAPSLSPKWAEYTPINTYSPYLGTIFIYIIKYISFTTLLLLFYTIINHVTYNKNKILLPLLFILFGILAKGIQQPESIAFGLLSGALLGIIMFILHHLFIRFDRSLIPLIVGSYTIALVAQQAAFNAYPNVLLGTILTSIIIGILSIYWHKKIQ